MAWCEVWHLRTDIAHYLLMQTLSTDTLHCEQRLPTSSLAYTDTGLSLVCLWFGAQKEF